MFNFFKKSLNLMAPISGKVIDLSEVSDPAFSQKMVGDGVAILSTGDVVVAPCDGEITLVMKTNHAIAMKTNNNIEILIHIGLETVSLKGKGFTPLVDLGAKVKAGTPLLKVDRKFIEGKGLSLVTPVLIVNPEITTLIKGKVGQTVEAGKDDIIEYKL